MCTDHFIQSNIQNTLLHGEQFCAGPDQLFTGRVAVPFVRQLIQGIEHAAAQADILLMVKSELFRDRVGGPESDPPDVVRQAVGILLHDLYAFISIGLIDLRCMARGDVMPLQEEHDVLDFLLLDPALFDPFHTDFSDSRDLQQIVRRSLDHFQRILAEFLHDLFGVFWADSLHQPASQIFLYAVNGCRQSLLELLDRELPAVSGVHFPESAQIKNAPDMHIRHLADDRHEVLKVLCPALDDRVSVLGILIRDALDDAPQMFHALSPAFLSERLLNVRPRWRMGVSLRSLYYSSYGLSAPGGTGRIGRPAKSGSRFRFMGLLYVISPFLSRYGLPGQHSSAMQEISGDLSPLTNRWASGRLIKAYTQTHGNVQGSGLVLCPLTLTRIPRQVSRVRPEFVMI